MKESTIKNLQATMKLHGFYDGEISGLWDDKAQAGFYRIVEAASDKVIKPVIEEPKYKLSITSLNRLKGIKPSLNRVVERAIFLSDVDFMVVEGLRTRAKQAEYVKKGASQTMNSKHLTGDAVDIVPYVNGKADWDNWDHIFTMTTAMQKAAIELGVNVRWGGAWVTLNGSSGTPYQWVEEYKANQRKLGKKAFMDGVHFELF